MTVSLDTHCLYSTVRNVSGQGKLFGFLPPHGRYLNDQEEMSVFGNILDVINHANLDFSSSRRWVQAFEAAVNRGDLVIVHTPNPIVEDTQLGDTKMLVLTNGTLGVANPCWSNTGSVIDDIRGGEDFTG